MKHRLLAAILFVLCISGIKAQERLLTLEEALTIAEERSLDALNARNVFLSAYWQYRNYKAELLPNVVLEGNVPSLNSSLSSYLKENGTYGFVKNNSISEDLTLSLSQNIPFSGGNISVQSALQRIDQLGGDKTTGYLSVPFSFTLNQPLFSPKTLKWAMRIEPERYKEARQQYQVDMESVYMKTINYYFDLLLAQTNLDIAAINQVNATKLHDIAKGKKGIGLISDNDLLQLELNKINAETEVISAEQTCEDKMLTFCNFLRLENNAELTPVVPNGLFKVNITLSQVRELAYKNHPVNHTITRRLLETRKLIDEAKANRGFKADLYVSLGYTGSDLTFSDSYRNLQNREIVSLGIRVPILDWGKGKGRVKLAESEQEVVKSQVEQTQLNFEQNIILSVSQFRDQSRLVALAQQADSIAGLRYETAFQTFVMGTINVLDINAAQIERDNAKRKHINELYLAWLCYYNLRQITLYDFQQETDIIHPEINAKK
ncbi:MAG: TolC family protein [Prevotellaceae bacterium]|jgi:outer membrane protein TolC|nr:TolC family protein [Prevotellaceae bacterium]